MEKGKGRAGTGGGGNGNGDGGDGVGERPAEHGECEQQEGDMNGRELLESITTIESTLADALFQEQVGHGTTHLLPGPAEKPEANAE